FQFPIVLPKDVIQKRFLRMIFKALVAVKILKADTPLLGIERRTVILVAGYRRVSTVAHIGVSDGYSAENDETLHHIAQLTDITGPRQLLQCLHRFARKFLHGNIIIATDLFTK